MSVYNSLLPYADALDAERDALFEATKRGLLSSFEGHHASLSHHYLTHLERFLDLKYRLSDGDLKELAEATYGALVRPPYDARLQAKLASVTRDLVRRVRKKATARPVLAWRALYDLYAPLFQGKTRPRAVAYSANSYLEGAYQQLLESCREFFEEGAAAQIVELVRPAMLDTFRRESAEAQALAQRLLSHRSSDLWMPLVWQAWDRRRGDSGAWNQTFMRMLARSCAHNIGRSSWLTEARQQKIFSAALSDLGVTLAGTRLPKVKSGGSSPCQKSFARIVVYSMRNETSSLLRHLGSYLASVSQYFHPSNTGPWTAKLNQFLVAYGAALSRRVKKERKHPSPDALSPDTVAHLTRLVQPLALQGLFSKDGDTRSRARGLLRDLGYLAPAEAFQGLVERLYDAAQSITANKQSGVAFETVSTLAHPLFLPEENREHLVPFMMMAIPGIDANDRPKTTSSIKLLLALCSLQPVSDGDFTFLLLERLFLFYSHLSARDTHSHFNMEGSMMRVLSIVLWAQMTPEVRASARKKVLLWLAAEQLPDAAADVAHLVQGMVLADPADTLAALVPVLSKPLFHEPGKHKAAWCHHLLGAACRVGGAALLPHVGTLQRVIDAALANSERKQDRKAGAALLSDLLAGLTRVYVQDYAGSGFVLKQQLSPSAWHSPTQAEVDEASRLALHYLERAESEGAKLGLQLSHALLCSLGDYLEEPTDLVEEHTDSKYFERSVATRTAPAPPALANVRSRIASLALRVAAEATGHDVSLLKRVSRLLVVYMTRRSASHHHVARALGVAMGLKEKFRKRTGKERPVFVHLLLLQGRHGRRCLAQNRHVLDSNTNRSLMDLALRLSLHGYEQVRKWGQEALAACSQQLRLATSRWIPRVIQHLADGEASEGHVKGATYVLGNGAIMSTITRKWHLLHPFLIALLGSGVHEAASVQKRVDALFTHLMSQAYELPVLTERDRTHYEALVRELVALSSAKVHWRYELMAATALVLTLRRSEPVLPEVAQFFASRLHDDVLVMRQLAAGILQIIMLHPEPPAFEVHSLPRLITHQVHAHQFAGDGEKRTASPSAGLSMAQLAKMSRRYLGNMDVTQLASMFSAGGLETLAGQATAFMSRLQKSWPRTYAPVDLEGFKLGHATLWKGLFKDHGVALPQEAEALLEGQRDAQCTAAEIFGGAARASLSVPWLQKALDAAAPDNVSDWCTAVRYAAKVPWVRALALQDPFREPGSTLQAKRVQYASAVLCESGEGAMELLPLLEGRLADDFKQVRVAVAQALETIYEVIIDDERCGALVDRMVERMSEDTGEPEVLSRYRDTCLSFFALAFRNCVAARNAPFRKRLPRVSSALLHSFHDPDADVQKLARGIAPLLAQYVYAPSDLPILKRQLGILRAELDTSDSWMQKVAVGPIVQILAFNHRFLLDSSDDVFPIASAMLLDANVDVRASGAALCRSLHTGEVDESVLAARFKLFRKWASSKVNRRQKGPRSPQESERLVRRHAGVLGYVALLESSPYEVPSWLPPVAMALVGHSRDPSVISASVSAALQNFWRTHSATFEKHEHKFSRDDLTQLKELGDFAPSYII